MEKTRQVHLYEFQAILVEFDCSKIVILRDMSERKMDRDILKQQVGNVVPNIAKIGTDG